MFRVNGEWNQGEQLLKESTLNGLESIQSKIQFLMIQRRDSLGFVEIMRGKYKVSDIEYIKQQIHGMTREEQQRIETLPFDTLWEQLWGAPQEGTHSYRNEREVSRQKLEQLRAGTPSLKQLIEEVKFCWPTPEWGFPKGRRDLKETEYACAMREMWEETGILEKTVLPIRNLDPISETFFGSNHVQYCHKYYLVYMPKVEDVSMNVCNEHMQREIGDIGWFSLEEAIGKIRPENVEKRQVLLKASSILRNYCPLLLTSRQDL
jgi:8-oxo-dGTP pyrophosphatase MutT (NUDIX family)